MGNLRPRVARLERRRLMIRPIKVKSVSEMTDAELLIAAGMPPDISDEEIEARIMAMDWDLILQRAKESTN
jgi:hypothetical protein